MENKAKLPPVEQENSETGLSELTNQETVTTQDEIEMLPSVDYTGEPEPCTPPGSYDSMLLCIQRFNARCRRNYDGFQWGPLKRNVPLRMHWGR